MRQASVSIWATGDTVRVSPETGRYLEDRRDIHADYPTGDYAALNAAWDRSAGRVVLHAARNEFVAFQVVVGSDGPVRGLAVRLDRLVGPGGAEISGRNVAMFKAWYVRVARKSTGYDRLSLGPGWYADALLPVSAGEPARFDIPDQRNGIGSTQRNQTVWIDIYVPAGREHVPPGTYRGEVEVSSAAGRQTIAVELNVWDFALPDETHCRGDIWNGSIRTMPAELELAYYQLARRHRFMPGVYGYRPGLTIRGADVSIDWTDYDARLGKYLDGSAFTERLGYWGPGAGLPIDHILIPFNCEKGEDASKAWPMAMPKGGPTPDFEAVWVQTARQVRDHFDANRPWQAVRKIIFLNSLDESYNEAAYRKMIYYCDLLRRGTGPGWFQYRIDGGYSWKALAMLAGHVDLWVCHTVGFDRAKIAHFGRKGIEAWFYGPMIYERRANDMCGSNTFIDLDLLTCRGVGWAAFKHRSGFCQWEFDWNADTAWTEPVNYARNDIAFNGSGLLIYRGEVMGLAGPVPSIRLKAHRRGFQDYEYFWLLGQAGRQRDADRLVNRVVHAVPFGRASIGNCEIWRNDPEAWDAARIEAGRLLHGVAPGSASR